MSTQFYRKRNFNILISPECFAFTLPPTLSEYNTEKSKGYLEKYERLKKYIIT